MMKQLVVLVSVSLISLFLFWSPFIFKIDSFWGIKFGGHGLETIVQNFDGLNYIAVAKTLYDPTQLEKVFVGFGNPPIYYAAHFPIFPLLIRAFDTVFDGPRSLLLAIIVSNILLCTSLYIFFETLLKDKKLATMLSVIALFFPARMLSVRMVGTSEPMFIAFVLLSLAMAYKRKHWWGAIWGGLAVLTRSPGILLFGAYLIQFTFTKKLKLCYPYLLMPLSLFLLFGWYGHQYGNFWAYFSSSSELHPVFFPPLLIFSNMTSWINGMWREDIIYIYLFYGMGICLLKDKTAKIFGILMGGLLLLTAHQDLGRYALPLAPIALLGFAPYLNHKNIRWLAILIIPIFLLGWQFVVANIQPISDWSKLL
ncbi:MAG: hypothetical protein WAV40_03835 [Microgenomates group bacterium]